MKKETSWQYNELNQVGTDYSDKSEVDIYDSRHSDFRDMEAESLKILDDLWINSDHALIDFGSGTGTFAIHAARRCARVYAVDVSQAMIEHAEANAVRAGITNIEFYNAGFLTYEHQDSPVDAIVTTFAFHHLPDFWKGIALKRMNSMLKPNGQLYIHDVILEEKDALNNIQMLIDNLKKIGGDRLREDTEKHFREEFSTYDWVMDGLLSRANFTIKTRQIKDGVLGTYICTRDERT